MAETRGGQKPESYFDTPERAERLQLVAHVIRNTDATPYIRGPEGAGKTRFAERLAAAFREEASLVPLVGTAVTNIPEAVCGALGISAERWPVAAIDAASDGGLLVLVDDADRLDPVALEALHDLKTAGGKLIFLGSGDPAGLPVQWELQLIDLPPFSESQVREFVEFLGDPAAVLLKDAQLTRLHRDCGGLPGAVIAVLAAGHGLVDSPVAEKRPRIGRVIGVVALAALVGLVLWQQDRINRWFEPQQGPAPAVPAPPVVAEPVQPTAPAAVVQEEPAVVPEPTVGALPAPPSQPAVMPEPAAEPAQPPVIAPEPVVAEPAPVPESPEPPVTEKAVEPAPAQPVVEVVAPPVAPEPAQAAVPVEEAPPAAVPDKPGQRDLDWLRERDPKAYTLQLVGARDRHSIDGFVARYGLPGNYVVYERELGGKPWYSLIYGEYPDLPAARRGRAALPKDLSSAWPRTFESVIQQLPPAD